MPIKPCFELHGMKDLQAKYAERIKDGMSEHEQRMVGAEIVEEHLNKLNDDLNKLKKEAKKAAEAPKKIVKKEAAEKVEKEFEAKKPEPPKELDDDLRKVKYASENSWVSFQLKYPDITKQEYLDLKDRHKEVGYDKLIDEQESLAEQKPIKVKGEDNTVDQYVAKAKSVLAQLFPDHTIKVHEKNEDYIREEKRPEGSAGVFHPETKTIALNLEAIRKAGADNTVLHEVIHPIVREALEHDSEVLADAYDKIKELSQDPELKGVFEHENMYADRSIHIQRVEAVTEFLTKVADGSIDPSKVKKDLSTKIVELVNKVLKAIGVDKQFKTASDLRVLADNIKKAFDTEDATALKESLGRVEGEKGGPSMDKLIDEDESKLRDTIKKYPDWDKKEFEEQLDKVGAFGKNFTKEEFSKIFDEVRGEKPPVKPPKSKEVEGGNENLTSIKLADTAETRDEFGLPEYERTAQTEQEWIDKADEALRNGYDVAGLVKKMEDGYIPHEYEQVILAKQKAYLDEQVAKDPSDENIAKLSRFIKAADTAAGSAAGRSLRARQVMVSVDKTLGDFLLADMESLKVEKLTDAQKEQNVKEFTEISELQKKFDAELEKAKAEAEKLRAENELLKAKDSVERMRKASPKKKTHEEYVAERKQIRDNIKDKLKKLRGDTQSTIVPYARELVAIAPDVSKYVTSLISEGVDNLADIIDRVHEEIKDDIPGVQKEDVRDVIAGKYNERKPTDVELKVKKRNLQTEAKLLGEIERIKAGESKPRSEKKQVQDNKRIAELKKELSDLTGKDADAYSESYIKKAQKEIDSINEQLKSGDFSKAEKPEPIKLSPEALKIKDELITKRRERHIRILKQEFENHTNWQKAGNEIVKYMNVPRTIMSSMDFSAPLRQGVIPTISHPQIAKAAAEAMFKALDKKSFDRYFSDLKQDPRYEAMVKSKLPIADTESPYLQAREESYISSGIVEKIPGIGHMVAGSERAYVMYLNKMRVDLFNMFADKFEADGKTYQNSKQLYDKMAEYVGNITGRGQLGPIESWAPVLNAAFFSPRLIASRLTMLNPVYFARLPKELKKAYLRDMGSFIGTSLTVLGVFAAYGASQSDDDKDKVSVEIDPRSADFLKIKQGRTRWDILGGFQQYVRAASQFAAGQRKSTTTGDITELNGEGAFGQNRSDVIVSLFRNKFSPVLSSGIDIATHHTAGGEPVTLSKELLNYLTPMIVPSVIEAYGDGGVGKALGVFVPSTFGVGTQTYSERAPREKTFRVYNSNDNTSRDATHEEYDKYIELREKNYNDEIYKLRETNVWKDTYGEITTSEDKKDSEIATDQLTPDEWKKLQTLLKAKASRNAKKQLFEGKEESANK